MSQNIAAAGSSVQPLQDIGISLNPPTGALGEPSRAFVDHWRRAVDLGYAAAPVNLFDKNPGFPGPLATEGFLIRQAKEGYYPPAGAWLNGPYFFGLKWKHITLKGLQDGGQYRADYERYERKPSADFAGLGIIHNGHVIAVDVDAVDPEKVAKARALLDALPGASVEVIGSRGFKRYYFVREGGIKKQAIVSTSQGFGIDILAEGSFSVAYGHHIGAGRRYVQSGDIALLNCPAEDLQNITGEEIEAFLAEMIPHDDRKKGKKDHDNLEARDWVANGDRFADAIHEAALANVSAWVPALFGSDARRDGNGYRARRVWDGFEGFNISIRDSGIYDHGAAKEGFSAVGLVERVLGCDWSEATDWLAGVLGLNFGDWSLDRKAEELAKETSVWLTINGGGVRILLPAGNAVLDAIRGGLPGIAATEEAVANDAPVDPVAFDFHSANAETLKAAEAARKAVVNLADRIIENHGSFRRLSKEWVAARSKINEAAPDSASKTKIIQAQMATAERNLENARIGLSKAAAAEEAARIAADKTRPGSEEDHILTEAQRKRASMQREVIAYRTQIEEDRAAIEDEEGRIAGEWLDRDELRNSPRPLPPIIPVNVYTGLGKTAVWVAEALPRLALSGLKVLHVADSIELAAEARAKFLEKVGEDAPVTTLLIGMDAKDEAGKPLCAMSDTVSKLKEYGLPTSSLCGFGMTEQCDYASKCPIFKARREILEDSPSIVFAASANLFVRQQFLDGFEPDVVAIDESFTDFGHGEPITVSIDELTKLPDLEDFEEPEELPDDADEKARKARDTAVGKRRELEMHHEAVVEFAALLKGARLRGVELDDDGSVAALDFTGICEQVNGSSFLPLAGLDGMTRVCGRRLKTLKEGRLSVAPNTSAEQMDSLLADADIDLSEINRLRAQVAFAYAVMDAANGGGLGRVPGLRLVGEKIRILPELRVESKWLGYGPNPVEAVILLNATPEDPDRVNYVLSKRVGGRLPNMQPQITVPRPPMAGSVSGRQLRRAPISASRRGEIARKAEVSSSGRQKNRGRVNKSGLAFILSDFMGDADPAKTVVIGPASVREWLAGELPEGVQFLARGKSRGVDRFKGFERLIYVDGFKPPQAARESDSRLLGVVLGAEDYERLDGVWRLKDAALRERVAARKRADIMQGIERLRTRWNTGEQQRFLVLSDVEGILPADEMTVDVWDATDARLSAIEAERQREFLKLMNAGVVSRHQGLMEKVHGRSFTRHELSALWEIAEGFAGAPNLHSIEFRQLPADKRNWSGAVSYRQDLDAIIEAAFGGAVELRDNVREADADRFGATVEVNIAPNTTASGAPHIIPLSSRQYEQVVGASRGASITATTELKANPPAGTQIVNVSFEGQRGKPSPWLIPDTMSDEAAAERIGEMTGRAVKSITAAGA